jgi:hypothetical protein
MAVISRLLWQVARSTGRTAARDAGAAAGADPRRILKGARLDPHWRRQEGGGAARLAPDELIVPPVGIGRWHGVDPHRPHDGWRSVWKLFGLLGWGGAVGAAWWLGSRTGRGPLAGVAELDRLGEALNGFDRVE